jgi:hypothetical protein
MIYCLNFIDFIDFLYIDIQMNATSLVIELTM